MPKIVFITGTDTGVGKTVVSGLLTSFFYQQGISVFPFKPLETGCTEEVEGKLVGPDAKALWELTEESFSLYEICPYAFRTPVAPIVAARKEAREIDTGLILKIIREKAEEHEILIVEGAGGLLVPIKKDYNYLDLVKDLGARVITVVGSRLGALNHALLSFKALEDVASLGYVFNEIYPREDSGELAALETNRAVLSELAKPYGQTELCHLENLGMAVRAKEISEIALSLEKVKRLAARIL